MHRHLRAFIALLVLVSGVVVATAASPSGAGVSAGTGHLYAVTCAQTGAPEQLLELSLENGSALSSNDLTGDEVECPTGLAWDGETMWGVDHNSNWLYQVPLGGGEVNPVTEITVFEGPCGLAYDPTSGSLWTVEFGSGDLYVLPTDGDQPTFFTATGLDICGLAYDPAADLLYAIDREDAGLYSIDPDDGTVELIGITGLQPVCAADWDSDDGRLLATFESEDTTQLWEVPTDGAAPIDLGTSDASYICGLGFIPGVQPEPMPTTTAAPSSTTSTTTRPDATTVAPRFTG